MKIPTTVTSIGKEFVEAAHRVTCSLATQGELVANAGRPTICAYEAPEFIIELINENAASKPYVNIDRYIGEETTIVVPDDIAGFPVKRISSLGNPEQIERIICSPDSPAVEWAKLYGVPWEVGEHTHAETILPGVAPTCTTTGLTEGKTCSLCGVVLVAQEVIPVLAHIEGSPVVLIQPTETSAGVQVIQCVICKEILHTEEIPATGSSRLPGDADNSGTVDIFDALRILQYDVGWDVVLNPDNAEVDGSGTVDIFDALLILQYDVGWDVELL